MASPRPLSLSIDSLGWVRVDASEMYIKARSLADRIFIIYGIFKERSGVIGHTSLGFLFICSAVQSLIMTVLGLYDLLIPITCFRLTVA